MNNKIVLIGVGNVGASFAYALLNQKTPVTELVLIDTNQEKAQGEAMDLNHSLAFAPAKMKIRVGDYRDTKDAKIVCITAGFNQKEGETRLDLIQKNKEIIIDITKKVMQYHFQGIFLIATNPLDIMTTTLYQTAQIASKKVIGSGTSLDTSRLRYLLGEHLQINPKNIHAYVIGEHGDSEFVPWSNATVGLKSIKDYLNDKILDNIYLNVKNSAYEIIKKKGFTNWGIGICLVKIVKAILGDENSIITVSCYNQEHNLFISYPAIINKDGVKDIINLKLTKNEQKLFLNSVNILKKELQKNFPPKSG